MLTIVATAPGPCGLTPYGQAMGRKVDVEELVSAWDIANRLGYRNATSFHSVRLRDPSFPAPVLRTGKGGHFLLWEWPDVLAWAYRHGRLEPRRRSLPSTSL